MTPYIDCRHAQAMLADLTDGELPLADQVALESHLRWCVVCACRLSDSRLIGDAIRLGARSLAREDESALAAVRASVVARVRSEREVSWAQRLRDACDDRRLLWPALGGTLALVVGVAVASVVLSAAADERPESLAAMIGVMSERGSERNPLTPAAAPSFGRPVELGKRFENRSSAGVSIPRVLDDTALFASPASSESEFTVAAVVNREGRVANYAVLRSSQQDDPSTSQLDAVQDTVRLSRFEPAQTPTGEAVAVNLIWVIVHQTVKPPRQATAVVRAVPAHRQISPVAPVVTPPLPPSEQRSSTFEASATA